MRWLVLLLLVANVVYFGWELDQQTRGEVSDARASLPVPSGGQTLVLLREMKSRPVPRAAEEPPAEVAAPGAAESGELVTQMPDISVSGPAGDAVQYSCFTFGPLPEQKQAVWLGDWFHARRGWAQSRSTQNPDRHLSWVYLAQKSRSAADAVMADLQKKGVRDYRLINRGNLENSISLGLFSSDESLNERLRELQQKGYAPVVVPYADVEQVYWLDVKIPATGDIVNEMYQGFPSRYPSVPVRCDQIAIAEPAP